MPSPEERSQWMKVVGAVTAAIIFAMGPWRLVRGALYGVVTIPRSRPSYSVDVATARSVSREHADQSAPPAGNPPEALTERISGQ
jgi:hypothetical protein